MSAVEGIHTRYWKTARGGYRYLEEKGAYERKNIIITV